MILLVVDYLTNMRKRRLRPIINGSRNPKTALDYAIISREEELKKIEDSYIDTNKKYYSNSNSSNSISSFSNNNNDK